MAVDGEDEKKLLEPDTVEGDKPEPPPAKVWEQPDTSNAKPKQYRTVEFTYKNGDKGGMRNVVDDIPTILEAARQTGA